MSDNIFEGLLPAKNPEVPIPGMMGNAPVAPVQSIVPPSDNIFAGLTGAGKQQFPEAPKEAQREVPPWAAMGGSLKATKEGRLDFFRKTMPDFEFAEVPPYEGAVPTVLYRPRSSGPNGLWHHANTPGLSWGDVSEFSATAPSQAGAIAGYAIGKTPLAAGVGAATGKTIEQAIGALLPGQEGPQHVLEPMQKPLEAALWAGGSQLIGDKVSGMLQQKIPTAKDLFAQTLVKKLQAEPKRMQFAMEGLTAAERQSIPLDIADVTGNDFLKLSKGYIGRSTPAYNLIKQNFNVLEGRFGQRFETLTNSLGTRLSSEGYGQSVAEAATNLTDKLRSSISAASTKLAEIDSTPGKTRDNSYCKLCATP
jgi:hypothetical protein